MKTPEGIDDEDVRASALGVETHEEGPERFDANLEQSSQAPGMPTGLGQLPCAFEAASGAVFAGVLGAVMGGGEF